MLKIIRSQFYQYGLDKAVPLLLTAWLLIDLISFISTVVQPGYTIDFPSGGAFILEIMYNNSAPMFVVPLTVLMMSKDMSDKTLNYELLSGHTRAQVFFARFICTSTVCIATTLLEIWIFTLCYMPAVGGWGKQLSLSGGIIRTLLMAAAIFRLCAETTLVTMFLKRKGIAYFYVLFTLFVGDIITGELTSIMWEIADQSQYGAIQNALDKLDWVFQLFITNVFQSIAIAEYVKIKQPDGTLLKIFDAVPEDIVWLLIMSAGLGILMLLIAFNIFRRKDLE